MWRISSDLINKCCYRNQKVTYCDCVRASILEIYRDGKKMNSAFIGANTRIIYRSEASRMVYFIQISAEMWHFEESGQVIFHKMINSFLPEVFKRWHDQGAHHVVTIILFTSVDISNGESKLGHGEVATKTKDYFRVVVDQVHISKWSEIMETLRYEFSRFDRDVLLQEDGKIQGKILPAVKGNLLQAISIATSLVSSKFIDRDLRRTGVQTLIITPGSGIFDVDYDLMYQTSLKLLSIEIGIDLVCLSRDPLHITPLLRYKDSGGAVKHCVPSWLDISFWSSTEKYTKQWIPRCKIYEIQMMGVMENEVSAISIDYLPQGFSTSKYSDDLMDDYDHAIFKSREALLTQRIVDESVAPPALVPAPAISTRALTVDTPQSFDRETPTFIDNVSSSSSSIISATTSIQSREPTLALPTSAPAVASLTESKPKSALTSLLSLGVTPHPPTSVSTVNSPVLIPSSDRHFWSFPRKKSTASRKLADPKEEHFTTANQFAKLFHHNSLDLNAKANQSPDSTSHKEEHSRAPVEELSHSSAVPITTFNRFTKTPSSQFAYANSPPTRLSQSAGKRASFPRLPPDFVSKPMESKDKKSTDERHSMWMTISNPSNVPPNQISNISNYGRWQFVYPKKVKRRAVKWRSLRSPAALPLVTSIFPSVTQFKKNYTFQIYDASLYQDSSEYSSTSELLHEMVAIRLAMGFQIVAKDRVKSIEAQSKPYGNPNGVVEVVPDDTISCRIYMSMGNHIHRLACDMHGTINVQLYTNSDLTFLQLNQNYCPFVKTKYETKYRQTSIDFFSNTVRTFNWNQIDQILTGNEEYILDDPRMYRVRLALVPVDVPVSTINKPFDDGPDRLNAEEIRLEGLKKLIILIHRGRYYSREEGRAKVTPKQLSASVPDVKYYTGDLGAFLLQLKQTYDSDAFSGITCKKDSLLIQPTERFTRRINLAQLAAEMQGEKGVKFFDRRWHWKTHYHCFMGSEFVTWLLSNFTDIETPEEAVEYGNYLWKQKLLHHVENRHSFLNGNYFYHLYPEYVTPEIRDKQARFGKRSAVSDFGLGKTRGRSHSSTSLAGTARILENVVPPSPSMKPQVSSNSPTSSPNGDKALPKVLISRSIPYNVDMAGRSKRPEILTFHFDRVHNPENCFQMRLEWLNTTPKLVDEAIINIGRVTEQYGLKLVQAPIQEISQLPNSNPFVSLFRTRFILDPAAATRPNPNFKSGDENSNSGSDAALFATTSDPLDEDPLYFHKYALKSIGYYLDVDTLSETATRSLDIQYSWGKPFYQHSQYLHKSGLALVQVMADGEFVFMTNFLAASRIGLSPREQQVQNAAAMPSSDDLLRELKELCASEQRLISLYIKAIAAWVSKGRSDLDKLYN